MTREDILEQYKVNGVGVIQSPGKFEGNMFYVPYFYDCALQGMYDEDLAGVFFIPFDAEDRKVFPEIGASWGIAIEESDQGFIYAREYSTQVEYNSAISDAEEYEATNQY